MSKVIIVQVGWAAESNKSWIAADGGTDDRPGTTLNISENTSEQNRSGKVTYTQAESGNRVVVNVNQEGKEAPPPKYTYTIRTNEPDVEFLVYKGEEEGEDFVEIERVTASMVVDGKYVATFETEEENGRYRIKPLKKVAAIAIVDFNFSGSTNTSFTRTVSSSTASFDLRPTDSHRKQAIISAIGWSSTSKVFNASREVEIDTVTTDKLWGEGAEHPIYSAECFQAEDEEEPQCCSGYEETHIDRYDNWGRFTIGVPTTSIAGKVFAKNGKFTADIVYRHVDAFKYVVSTHLLLDVNIFVGGENSRYYGFKIRRGDPVVDEMLNSACQPEFTWKNWNGSNRTAEALMIKDDEYAYWVICIEHEGDFPDNSGVHYHYCGAYLSADTDSISFEKDGGVMTIPVSACCIDLEKTISSDDYWSGSEVDTSKTEDETDQLDPAFGYDILSGNDNVTVTETCGDFIWNGGSSFGSVLVEVGENNTGREIADILRIVNGGGGGDCCIGAFDIALRQSSGSPESTWYWAFRITKPSIVTATSVPHVVVENESGEEVFNRDWVPIGERIQVDEKTVPSGSPTPGSYTIRIDEFEDSVINTSEPSVGFENGVSAITLDKSSNPPTFTVVRKPYTPVTVKTITVSADFKMVGSVNGEIHPSTDANAATEVPLAVTASCIEWKAEITNGTIKDWLSIWKNGDSLVLNFTRDYDRENERAWQSKNIKITSNCDSGVNFNAKKNVLAYREPVPYDGDFFVSGRSDFYDENVSASPGTYAECRQRYLFTPTGTSPFDFMSGDTGTTLIPAYSYLDDLRMFPNVVFYDAETETETYGYVEKYDKLHLYDVVYYKDGVLYHSVEKLTAGTVTDNAGSGWSGFNEAIGSGGTGLTFTTSMGNESVNMIMGGFNNSDAVSSAILESGFAGYTFRTGLLSPGNSADSFSVRYEIAGIPRGLWPPSLFRASDYDVVINDPHFSSNGTDIVEIVTIDGVEYYLIRDYNKVTVTLKNNNGEG